jgi:hypothetical protein
MQVADPARLEPSVKVGEDDQARADGSSTGSTYQQYTHAGTSLCLDTVGGAGSQLMELRRNQ